ncbi:MAG: hypothetical protein COW84_01830 [Gammaproteobacteria bacterium CG22_combo_CG10-13_8_21_14_all_40_8]|nr:MAG: hypothetical protein COW84_01830 [Gammaproteobacteria bacterium CG22_combo_CG10-13_8_21_14_all_40_8]
MFRFISFFTLLLTKWLSSLFYRYQVRWFDDLPQHDWSNINMVVFLNHTSLFEPLFVKVAPNGFLWRLSKHLVAPGADITLNRPILGKFIKLLVPGCIPITRKNDESWQAFLDYIKDDSIALILPEGRMKRRDGQDKEGNPMSARGGIADILLRVNSGKVLFVYSGGLHHIQAPGDKLPRLFKTIQVNLELVSIDFYKELLSKSKTGSFKQSVIKDLNLRLKHLVPQ